MNKSNNTPPLSGASYFFKGFELIRMKGVRRFVFIPLAINLLLFSFAFSYLLNQIDYLMAWVDSITHRASPLHLPVARSALYDSTVL